MAAQAPSWVGVELSGGRYRVLALLGEGGMGLVYRARDRNLGCDVVVKAPRRAMLEDPEFAPRFIREVRSLVHLAHPHIVRITDVGSHEGVPYAVMQYLSGGALDGRRGVGPDDRPGPVEAEALGDWLPAIAGALDFVHAKGYLHRDVKPANILFDDQGHAYLSDFGVIKVLASDQQSARSRAATASSVVLGTPEYMAPELIMGGAIDGRADQYALALSVYEVLTGRRPFDGPTSTAVLVQQSTEPPARLRVSCPWLPEELDAAVHRGLAKRPEERFRTCTEFAGAVILASRGATSPPAAVRPAPAVASEAWFWMRGGAVQGPTTLDDLARMAADGVLAQETLVRPEGSNASWTTARSVAGIDFPARAASAQAEHARRRTRTITVGLAAIALVSVSIIPWIGSTARRDASSGRPAARPSGPTTATRGRTIPAATRSPAVPAPVGEILPPQLADIPPQTVDEGATLTVSARVLAPANSAVRLRYALVDPPANARIDPDSGEFSWRPGEDQGPKTHRLKIRVAVADRPDLQSDMSFIAVVNEVNHPPELEPIENQAIDQGGTWSLTVRASDPDVPANRLAYRLAGEVPEGARIDEATGEISWQPTLWQSSSTQKLTVEVRDDGFPSSAAVRSFGVTVAKPSIRSNDMINGLDSAPFALAVSPVGHALVASGINGRFRLWKSTGEGRTQVVVERPDRVGPAPLAFSPDGRLLATGGGARTVFLYDWDGEQIKQRTIIRTNNTLVQSLAFSPDGQSLATGGDGHSPQLWAVAERTWKVRAVLANPWPVSIQSMAFSPGGDSLALGSSQPGDRSRFPGSVKVWNPSAVALRYEFLAHNDGAIRAMTFALNGRYLATGSFDSTIKLWKHSEGAANLKGTLTGHKGPIWCLAALADDRYLASGGGDHTIRLWDLQDQREILTLEGHTGPVMCLAVSSDGRVLISGADDGTIRFWPLARPGS